MAIKGIVRTLDEIKKSDKKPKLTKDEALQWLRVRISRRVKDELRYPDKDSPPTIDNVAQKVYENIVDDWTYNSEILEACRAVGFNQAYVSSIVTGFFDGEGKPLPIKGSSGPEVAKTAGEPAVELGRSLSNLTTIDDEFDELAKTSEGAKKAWLTRRGGSSHKKAGKSAKWSKLDSIFKKHHGGRGALVKKVKAAGMTEKDLDRYLNLTDTKAARAEFARGK